jgi:tetratricopeptide (TPR) repeat protein
MGVDRYRVCELYVAGPESEGSGSGYRVGDRLVLTARHVIAPALSGPGGQVLVRPVGMRGWLSARVDWQDVDADAALIVIEDKGWRAPTGESVLRWGELAGSDLVPCAAVRFPWASVRPDRVRDTAHVYGQLAPLGQLKAGRLDLDVASASPSAREGGSPWAGMSGAAVIADNHLVGVITVDPARYADRLVAVPVRGLLADEGFRARLGACGVRAAAVPVGAGWYLRLPGEQAVSLALAYRPVSRRLRPAPSTLLRPEHGLVPFLGRQALLDQVTGWPQGPDRPLLLVTGGGGSGKTRLAREACVQMLVAGWDAGLADDKRRDGTATTELERPTLLVIDDADLHTSLISALVGYLKQDDAGPEVRLLLLARAAGAWWDRLVRQQELDGAYTVLDLDRYPVPAADRAEHFHRASVAFGAYRDPGAPLADAPPPVGLDDPAYAEPLLIHIAALLGTVAISTTPAPDPGREHTLGKDLTADQDPPVRQTLLRTLCQREQDRWHDLGEQSHLSFNPDLPLADQVVALATLTAAVDKPCATSLLAAVPNQAEVTRIGAEGLVAWAHRLYSGPGYWNPLRPDLLAEQHLADTAQLPALATTAARLAAGQQWEAGLLTQLLAELTRGAPDQPTVRAALDELLAGALPRIVDLAITGHPELADLISLALELAPQPGLAAELADQMPAVHSVQLAALAATLAGQQVTQYRADALGGDTDAASRLAGSSINLSARLSDLGRPEEALAASQEAVTIFRELAAARPEEFRDGLAAALTNLSVDLGDLGRPEEALAAIQDAVTILRELAAARPEEFRLALARALSNLSVSLDDLERPGALAAIQEAVGVYRELAAARPEEFRDGLAAALINLSAQLAGQLGRQEETLAAAQEAVGVYRELAAARPDVFRPGLARSLANLADALGYMGRLEEALDAIQEAVTIRRELSAARPDKFSPALASSLSVLAHVVGAQGRHEEELAARQEAVTIRRELAAARPEEFWPALASSLDDLSFELERSGRREEALAASQEAVSVYRELAVARTEESQDDLVTSLNALSAELARLGRREEALAASQEAVGIYRELAVARTEEFPDDLADYLNDLAIHLGKLGWPEEALAAAQEAVGIYRELAAARPEEFRDGLVSSLETLAPVLATLGRREESLAASQEADTIRRELASRQPDA